MAPILKRIEKAEASQQTGPGRAQMLWSLCVAIVVAIVALQQAIGSRPPSRRTASSHAKTTVYDSPKLPDILAEKPVSTVWTHGKPLWQ